MCDLLETICPDARLQGTIQALFAEGKFNPCLANSAPTQFCNLKTISGFSIQQEPETETRYKWSCGKKEVVGKIVKEDGFMLQTTLQDLTIPNIKRIMRGKDVTPIAQGALTAQAIDSFDFSAKSSESDDLYFLTDSSSGAKLPVYNVTALILSTGGVPLVEGTDFVFRKTMGAVKFLTSQNSIVAVEVTASVTNTTPLELGGSNVTEGWLRVMYFPTQDTVGDQCEPEMFIDAAGFINFEEELGFNLDEPAEAQMSFEVSGNPVLTDLRNL